MKLGNFMLFYSPIIQTLHFNSNHQVDVLRLDLLHPEISGNKWFKLKHNLQKAIEQKHKLVITFGGAFSNHIAATAAACKLFNIKCIGLIRGEEHLSISPDLTNSTLRKAKENGMHLHFVNREWYAKKNEEAFKKYLNEKFGAHYLIPEGGNNMEGVLGCMEILATDYTDTTERHAEFISASQQILKQVQNNDFQNYDYIFCACGTGTTFAGIVASVKLNQTVIGISVLKGENKLPQESENLLRHIFPEKKLKIFGNEELEKNKVENHFITNHYCFLGYAKFDKQLIEFKNEFEHRHKIPLDYVYTNKLFFGAFDLIKENKLRPASKILIIHSGGLQGNQGFETRYHLMPIL